ncbi:VanZ family protein [Ruminococcus gauvreauii]
MNSVSSNQSDVAIQLGLLSFSIEIVQLFTLHRATDINDFITNIVGTLKI